MSKVHDNMKRRDDISDVVGKFPIPKKLKSVGVREDELGNKYVFDKETFNFVKESEWEWKDGDDSGLATGTKELVTDDGRTLRIVRTYYNGDKDSRGWTMAEHLAHITLEACGSMGSMSEYREDYYLFGTDGKLIKRWWIFA